MRFALVLFLVILSFGVRPAKAQQLRVTGQLEVSNGSERPRPSPGGYLVELYIDKFWKGSGTTGTNGSYTIVPNQGIDVDLLKLSRVICRHPGKYAYSPLYFQRNDSGYEANVPLLKLLSTTEAKYTPEKARETIQVLVTVEALLFKAGIIGSFQINVTDAVSVLEKTPQAKRRAIVDNLKLDPTLPSEVLDQFRKYLAP